MNSGTLTPIKNLYSGLFDGPHATPKPADSGPVFLGIKNITDDGHFNFSDIRHISYEEYPRWIKRVKPSAGDIVFTYEATLNRYAIIRDGFEGCLGRRMALIRPNENKAHNKYLYYYFFSPEWRATIKKNMLNGSTVDRIPLTRFPEFPVRTYPIATQQKIAGILGAYDDLIENNSKRIEKLEAMARLLYSEMFTGAVSDNWPRKNVKELIKRISPGKLYAQKNVLDEGKVPVFDQGRSGIIGYHNDEPGVIASYDKPIITFANHTCYQRLVFHPFSAIQNVLPFLPSNQHDIYWLHYATKDLVKLNDYKGHWPEFMSKNVAVPTESLSIEFGEKVKPILVLIDKLEQKNNKLAKARDLLLPRLMSGEIEV